MSTTGHALGFKKDPPKFTNPKSNAWRLVPAPAIQFSEKAVAAGKEAARHYCNGSLMSIRQRLGPCSQREIKDPLGFKWIENYVPPRNRGNDNAAAQKKSKNMPQAKSPEVPKL